MCDGQTDGQTDGKYHSLSCWSQLKNNGTPLLYYVKLCAWFQTHWWIQTAVTVQKRSIWVKIGDFLSCVTLKFDGWPWQTIGHLFYATSSFVNRFKPSVNSNWSDSPETLNSAQNQPYLSLVTLKFHGWPWKTIGHLFYPKIPNLGQIRFFFSPVTLKFDG